MIARKVHYLTKTKKQKNTFARKVPSLTKTTQKNMIVRKVHSLTAKTNVMIARKVVLQFLLTKCNNCSKSYVVDKHTKKTKTKS